MHHALVDRDQVEDFVALTGEPDQRKDMGSQVALFYKEFPDLDDVERSGSWYRVCISIQGGTKALQLIADQEFNEV